MTSFVPLFLVLCPPLGLAQMSRRRLEILKSTAKTHSGEMSAEDGETDDDFEDDFEDSDDSDDDE